MGNAGRIEPDAIAACDVRKGLASIRRGSVALSLFSPPYLTGKAYERDLTLESWQALIAEVLHLHAEVLQPGGIAVVNVAHHRSWPGPAVEEHGKAANQHRTSGPTAAEVAAAEATHPELGQRGIARLLGCSEQTVARWRGGNNRRTGAHRPSVVLPLGNEIDAAAAGAGLRAYDRRIWHKSPAWSTCRWHASSYRAIDEFEHLLMYRRPGPMRYERERLTPAEWAQWGSRGVWTIPSVKSQGRHGAEFPDGLAERVVRLLSSPGETVIDPFAGTGTTTAAARRLGRRWIGIERDERNASIAAARTALLRYRPIGSIGAG